MTHRTKTHYEILGVQTNAGRHEIDDAFDAIEEKLYPEDFGSQQKTSRLNPFTKLKRAMRYGEASLSHKVLMDDAKRAAYDKDLMIYALPKYVFDSSFLQTGTRVMMAIIGVIVLMFVWQALTHREASTYLMERYAANSSPQSFINGVVIYFIIAIVRSVVMRKRWGEYRQSQAVKDLRNQATNFVLWLLALFSLGMLVFAQAIYASL